MTNNPTVRRRVARGLAISALSATALTGVLAAPASAATSRGYDTMSECRAAQVATGASSFVRISRSCYSYIPQIAPGVWDPNYVRYRFEYVARSN